MRALNRCQLKGTLIQAGKQVIESQEVVRFDFAFGDSKVVPCIVPMSGSRTKSFGFL